MASTDSELSRYTSLSSTDADTNGEESSIFGNIWNSKALTTYETPKVAKVKSRWLQLPLMVMRLLCIFILVLYIVIYKLEFMKDVTAEGISVVDVIPPLQNFWSCNDMDVDCKYSTLNKDDFPYCKGSPAYNVSGCHYMSHHEVPNLKFARSMFLPTSLKRIKQNREPNFSKLNREWTATEVTTKYIIGIERYMLNIRTTFSSVACRRGCSSTETQGLLENSDGAVTKLPCITTNGHRGSCNFAGMAKEWDALDSCGDARDGSPFMCSGTVWGDYISVYKILAAAGINLDQSGTSDIPIRLKGASLVLHVKYENAVPYEYWLWPFGRKWKYTYSFRESAIGGINSNEYEMPPQAFGSDERILIKYTGIPILLAPSGELRIFSLPKALLAFVVSLSAISICEFLVETLLLRVYTCTSRGKLISAMFEMAKNTQSPTEDEVRSVADQHDTSVAMNLVALHQSCRLRQAEEIANELR